MNNKKHSIGNEFSIEKAKNIARNLSKNYENPNLKVLHDGPIRWPYMNVRSLEKGDDGKFKIYENEKVHSERDTFMRVMTAEN